MKQNNVLILTTLCAALGFSSVAIALPAEKNQLRVHTSESKRNIDTAFSTLVSWRKGAENVHRVNGLIFIEGLDSKTPMSAAKIAHKAANQLNADIKYDAPMERGAMAEFTKDKPEFTISNKEGFDLVQITTRDYSNQKLQYAIPEQSFSSAAVNVAIDLVYSADVEFIEGFSVDVNKKTAGGFVSVAIDNEPAIEIQTEGKTPEQLEKELAQLIGAKATFSATPLYPNFVEGRNYKPFDGGEIQLPNLNAKTITIDVADSGLGVLTKFSFPDANKPTDVASKAPYIVGLLLTILLSGFWYLWKIKPRKENLQ